MQLGRKLRVEITARKGILQAKPAGPELSTGCKSWPKTAAASSSNWPRIADWVQILSKPAAAESSSWPEITDWVQIPALIEGQLLTGAAP